MNVVTYQSVYTCFLPPLQLNYMENLQGKRFHLLEILANILPQNTHKVSKIMSVYCKYKNYIA